MAEIARRTGLAYSTVSYHRDQLCDPETTTRAAPESAPTTLVPARTVTTRQEVHRLLSIGQSRAEAARILGISKSTVSYHARRFGMEIDDRAARRYDWDAIQRYYDAGHSVRECRARFGFNSASWTGAVRRGAIIPRPQEMPMAQLLVVARSRGNLKRRLLKEGLLPPRCRICGLTEWRGRPIGLQLHHINGDRVDNRLQNLQILCPNCHSQTDTWSGRNPGQRAAA